MLNTIEKEDNSSISRNCISNDRTQKRFLSVLLFLSKKNLLFLKRTQNAKPTIKPTEQENMFIFVFLCYFVKHFSIFSVIFYSNKYFSHKCMAIDNLEKGEGEGRIIMCNVNVKLT